MAKKKKTTYEEDFAELKRLVGGFSKSDRERIAAAVRREVNASGGMRVNSYNVLRRAVEEGIDYGLMRADKHVENPLTPERRSQIAESVVNAVMGEICEVFDFPQKDEAAD